MRGPWPVGAVAWFAARGTRCRGRDARQGPHGQLRLNARFGVVGSRFAERGGVACGDGRLDHVHHKQYDEKKVPDFWAR
jgi:hypothetical protein